MTLRVRVEKIRLLLWVPTVFALKKILSYDRENERAHSIQLTGKQKRQIRKIIRATKKKHKDWCLVEVQEHGKTMVKIKP